MTLLPYHVASQAELFETVKAFHAWKQEDGQSVSSYLLKMKSYLDTLECLGYKMPNELGVSLILNSLNKGYDQFIQKYNMHSMGKILVELHAMLKLHEKCISKKAETPAVLSIREGKIQKDKKKPQGAKDKAKGKNRLAYAPKTKIPLLPKRHSLAKDSICHHYKEHDGLLQPTHDESHEKCKFCISRKMAWKPFSHQVERAKDLLELKHTDVDRTPYEIWHGKAPRSGRIPQAPDRCGYYVDGEKYELGDIDEPPNYKAALADPKSDKWLEAMNTKMQSMKDNQVWYLVDLPSNGRIFGCKWLFKKKTDMHENVHTFKARLVAKGFTQTYSVDYRETISPVADIRALRILLAIVAFYDYEIWQMDVKIDFLNGSIMYAVKCTRLDVAFAQNLCSHFQQNPDMVPVYGEKPKDKLKVSCYIDASFQTDKDDTKSQTGYVFVLNGGVVDWKSAKQSTAAMSSLEAEYIATAEASMEVV
uniref:Putative retrotransposon Ty1-copia subclass protein n=1 Tax=Tanacetum cinerariifolium TaxID=118510 RepID=A0A6L2J737_TANCI|nr:putative retrotransposon Ty1-copia subclass protein [Tanacetum cinerariifolium]